MISKRGLVIAAATGAGAVLLTTGPAFACNINDFTVDATAACDTSTGTAKAAITVTDKDGSGTPADITVYERFANDTTQAVLGTAHIDHPTSAGVSTTILVPWQQGYSWIVSISAGNYINDQRLQVEPRSPDTPCEVPTSASPSASPTTATPTPSASPSKSAPATAASPVAAKAPSTPTPSASATGGTSLAETGGGSDGGMIAGAAAALLALGGGILYFLRRRNAVSGH